jgi:hypothetical protein
MTHMTQGDGPAMGAAIARACIFASVEALYWEMRHGASCWRDRMPFADALSVFQPSVGGPPSANFSTISLIKPRILTITHPYPMLGIDLEVMQTMLLHRT